MYSHLATLTGPSVRYMLNRIPDTVPLLTPGQGGVGALSCPTLSFLNHSELGVLLLACFFWPSLATPEVFSGPPLPTQVFPAVPLTSTLLRKHQFPVATSLHPFWT